MEHREEEEEKQKNSSDKYTVEDPATADSFPTRSHQDVRDPKPLSPSPARSSISDTTHRSSLGEEKIPITPTENRSGNLTAKPPSSARSSISISSDTTHRSSLSHGRPSLGEENVPINTTENRSGNLTAKPPSPARSSISSDLSHQSSLSHESSPSEERITITPTEYPPGKSSAEKHPSAPPHTVVNRSVRDEPVAATTKMDPEFRDGFTNGVGKEGGGGGGKRSRPSLSILRRPKMDVMVKKMALGFRGFGMAFCLVSLSVMAADKNQGWALDSFHRYKEFRYCISVNVIGFVYSGAQASYLAYHLATGKHISSNPLRYYFDFSLDQVLTYLLISASSSASTRIDDWRSNWGKDKFPDMASASVAMSFLAFVALAWSSLISGYILCTFKST